MGRDSFSVTRSKICLAPTMTWSTSLAQRVTWSGASLDGNERLLPSLCAAPCAWSLQEPVESFPFQRLNCVPLISRLGIPCVKRSIIATRVVEISSASVAIHKRILPHWNNVSSDQVCHPSFFASSVESQGQNVWGTFALIRGLCILSTQKMNHIL